MAEPMLDVITIGRSSVDLYGEQVGGRLENMASFSKAVGGCPTNIAIGTARLGLKKRPRHPGRRRAHGPLHPGTAGARGRRRRRRPYRSGSADRAGAARHPQFEAVPADLLPRQLRRRRPRPESDIDEAHIASAAAIVVTGTHFAKESSAAAQEAGDAPRARRHGRRSSSSTSTTARTSGASPGHGAGEERFIASDAEVSAHLAPVLADCDVIVGTEEELMIAGGVEDPLDAIRAIRALSPEAP